METLALDNLDNFIGGKEKLVKYSFDLRDSWVHISSALFIFQSDLQIRLLISPWSCEPETVFLLSVKRKPHPLSSIWGIQHK